MIHAPASVPASIFFLMRDQMADGARDCRIVVSHPPPAQRFHHPACYVRAGWIEHGVVIGERNFVEHLPVVVDIEGGPTSIRRLRSEEHTSELQSLRHLV